MLHTALHYLCFSYGIYLHMYALLELCLFDQDSKNAPKYLQTGICCITNLNKMIPEVDKFRIVTQFLHWKKRSLIYKGER